MSEKKKIKFKLITHEKVVFDGLVDAIYAKSVDGEFGILPDHIPCMYALAIGVTKIENDGKSEYFSTLGGVLQFMNNEAVILTEDAENGKNIDVTVERAELEKNQAKIDSAKSKKEIEMADKIRANTLVRIKAALNYTSK